MLTIYTDYITERLKYTLSIIFDDRGIAWELTDDSSFYENAEGPKFYYSADLLLQDTLEIEASELLFDEGLKNYDLSKIDWEGVKVLSFDGITDVLASVFYAVSLYDDYLRTSKDKHGRNIGRHSVLFRNNWLEKLMVERWSLALIGLIERENNCSLNALPIPFKYLPTFDIDNAFAYRLKGGLRKQMSVFRDVLKGDKKRLAERRLVLSGKQKDPYDTFDLIEEIAKKEGDVKVFWLLGNYGKFDKNIHPKNKEFRTLIQHVSIFADCGLHPSYQSNSQANKLAIEKLRLEEILGRKVTHTRQHFLKVELPSTFRALEANGFTDDYSLGYADQLGFRAGIARPFFWFDLLENRKSNLRLHPISYMDGTLNEYMKLSIDEAKEKIAELRREVENFGGEFIALWHNETIGDYGIWKGWKKLLD